MSECTLILGGARSGKSKLAEQLATESDLEVVYIATAQAHDAEMEARIKHHQQQRPAHWMVHEEPINLVHTLQQLAQPSRCVLVDCLTLWLTNLLLNANAENLHKQLAALYQCLPTLPGTVLLVSNETGLGVVPMGELSRQYVDQAGWMHQRLAQLSQRVIFTVAGLPYVLKGPPL